MLSAAWMQSTLPALTAGLGLDGWFAAAPSDVHRIPATLAQLTEVQKAIRDHFTQGGSLASVVLVVLGIAVLMLVVYYLATRQDEARSPTLENSPSALFRDLLGKLPLDGRQRELLCTVARDLELPHPAILTLSPAIYIDLLGQWTKKQTRLAKKYDAELIKRTRQALFEE